MIERLMFVGHYAPALLAKRKFPSVPLWCLFLASQGPDILYFLFLPFGLEKVAIDHSLRGPLSLDFYHMPYSHSLAGVLLVAFILIAAGAALKRTRFGLALALVYFSHWLLDIPVHRADLPLWFDGEAKIGLGLWHYGWQSFSIEIAMVVGAMLWFFRGKRWLARHYLLLITLVVSQTIYTYIIPFPPWEWVFSLLVFAVFAWQAWNSERALNAPDSQTRH